MKVLRCIVMAFFLISFGFAQQVHKIPFASSGNTIELAVENASAKDVTNILVTIKDIPAWLHVSNDESLLNQLKSNKEEIVVFTFSVDKTAPINTEQRLKFTVSTPSGETWTKEISISILPPEQFALFQNFPNPFNPTTRFEYALPSDEHVTLRIINTLGQEVKTLVDEFQSAGYKSVEFDAGGLPSGMYFYRLQAGTFTDIKKMVLMK